jgi:hypothetical protein
MVICAISPLRNPPDQSTKAAADLSEPTEAQQKDETCGSVIGM